MFAQNKTPALEQIIKEHLSEQLKKDSIDVYSFSPKLKPGPTLQDSLKFPDLKKKYSWPLNVDSLYVFQDKPMVELCMPVVGGGYQIKMPIAVPDSTVYYFIKEKRVEFLNPLEHKHK